MLAFLFGGFYLRQQHTSSARPSDLTPVSYGLDRPDSRAAHGGLGNSGVARLEPEDSAVMGASAMPRRNANGERRPTLAISRLYVVRHSPSSTINQRGDPPGDEGSRTRVMSSRLTVGEIFLEPVVDFVVCGHGEIPIGIRAVAFGCS